MASGKTTVARVLARLLEAERLGADDTRQALFESGDAEAFVPGHSKQVYRALFREAAARLDAGASVVLDGTFRSRALRAEARRLAAERGIPFAFVECRAGVEACRARVGERDRALAAGQRSWERDRALATGQRSWERLFESFLPLWEPAAELASEEHLVLDTAADEAGLEERLVALWPSVLRGS